jgi:enterochelin esterase-like enzyme
MKLPRLFCIVAIAATVLAQARSAQPSFPAPEWIKPPVAAPRLSHEKFASRLAGTEISYLIYKPEEYDTQPAQRFPVMYWLHGVGGGQTGIAAMVARFDAAIRAQQTPPMLVVFVNGLAESMWSDSKDGLVPMESIIIRELIPHIDCSYRTRATREGRLLEGFSMGGFGAARLGFKYPDLFGGISLLAAALHNEQTIQERTAPIFQKVFGGDEEYFRTGSPWTLTQAGAREAIARHTPVRQVVGDRDPTMGFNRDYHSFLEKLGVPHGYTVLPDVRHNPNQIYESLGAANWEFYRSVFAPSPEFKRTRVIGYSQVGRPRDGWFVVDGIFESLVGDEHWELLWENGAGVDRWRDPAFAGWTRPLVSACPGDAPVDRVVLSISGPYGEDESAWADAIEATIATIAGKIPSVRRIVLQAVAGGPGGEPCPAPGGKSRRGDTRVRASWQHPHIVNAINTVVRRRADGAVEVTAGIQPLVGDCAHYADALGHLTPEGAAALARQIGAYYSR